MSEEVSQPLLSVIIPAYNEEKRIGETLEKMGSYLNKQPYSSEIIVVDDGSADRTAGIVRDLSPKYPHVAVIENPHRGKGFAVKTGMLAAKGKYRFLCDADLSMPVEQLPKFIKEMESNFDIVIGSREASGARRYDEPFLRHLMAHVFNLVIRCVLRLDYKDTQCGFKCFKEDAVGKLFPLQRSEGFGFDAELLFLARLYHCRVLEIPIEWYHYGNSKVRPFHHTLMMLKETLSILRNYRRHYYG